VLKRSGIAAALLLLAGAAALALLAGQRLGRSGETVPLAAADHGLLLETARLDEAWPGAALDPGRAEQRKTVFDGDETLLEYRYRGAGEAQGLFVRQAVYLEPSPLWARLTAWWLWGQTERELEQGGGGDFTLTRRDELFAWGDASRFGYVELGGRARGVFNLWQGSPPHHRTMLFCFARAVGIVTRCPMTTIPTVPSSPMFPTA